MRVRIQLPLRVIADELMRRDVTDLRARQASQRSDDCVLEGY
jgi:hypothetical protein